MLEVKAVATAAAPKVLVVEDEPGLRFITSESLEYDGEFSVILAKSADEAVEILKCTDGIECVFTDVRMPGRFNGLDLMRHVKESYPGLPVIVTSANLRPIELQADVTFMTKPYDLGHLSIAIRGMIDKFRGF